MNETVNMGAQFVEAIVGGFSSGGTGLATGLIDAFDAVTTTSAGTLTGVAQVGCTLIGFWLIVGVTRGLYAKFAHRV